jgi:hypothetical protein
MSEVASNHDLQMHNSIYAVLSLIARSGRGQQTPAAQEDSQSKAAQHSEERWLTVLPQQLPQ